MVLERQNEEKTFKLQCNYGNVLKAEIIEGNDRIRQAGYSFHEFKKFNVGMDDFTNSVSIFCEVCNANIILKD